MIGLHKCDTRADFDLQWQHMGYKMYRQSKGFIYRYHVPKYQMYHLPGNYFSYRQLTSDENWDLIFAFFEKQNKTQQQIRQ